MHITNELIHNPGVNEKLEEMDVEFIRGNLLYTSSFCELL
jgi:4-hydroxy-3-methylbut-2-enyl diphosphate reductase IspH